MLLFAGYLSQDYFDVETERIHSLTVRFLPGELEEDSTSAIFNTTIQQIESLSEDVSINEDEDVEIKEEPVEETDDQKFERIEKVQQERIQHLRNFCKANAYLGRMPATIWYR